MPSVSVIHTIQNISCQNNSIRIIKIYWLIRMICGVLRYVRNVTLNFETGFLVLEMWALLDLLQVIEVEPKQLSNFVAQRQT